MKWKKIALFPLTVIIFILAEIGALLSYRIWWSGNSDFFAPHEAPPKKVSVVIGLINIALFASIFIWAKITGVMK